ncbi:MAG: sulfite exporter TauE/SafE family protein [Gammaproteobacteria bacterium]|nr:sulfite exporter TauE/SafE family protein [Gammaproteobacteria bacterium]
MELAATQLLWLVSALLFAGVLAGLLAGLLGIGGGIIVVPAVYQVMLLAQAPQDHLMHIAVGTSLALIIPTSIRSAAAHHARGAVSAEVLRRWGWAIVVGVLIGVTVATLLDSASLALVFATVVLAMAGWLGFFGETFRLGERLPRGAGGASIPMSIGAVSALMGIGGGSLSVPAMTAYAIPVHRAVGTSAALGLLIAVPGTLGFIITGWSQQNLPPVSLGYVNLLAVACLLPTTLLAVPYGVRLAHHFPARTLRYAFAGFLFITGLRMAWAGVAPWLTQGG